MLTLALIRRFDDSSCCRGLLGNKLLDFLRVVGHLNDMVVPLFLEALKVLHLHLELLHLSLELVMYLSSVPRLDLINRDGFLQSLIAGTIPIVMHFILFHKISHALRQHLILRSDPIAFPKK